MGQKSRFIQDGYSQLLCFFKLAACIFAGNHIRCVLADAATNLSAKSFYQIVDFVSTEFFERSRDNVGFSFDDQFQFVDRIGQMPCLNTHRFKVEHQFASVLAREETMHAGRDNASDFLDGAECLLGGNLEVLDRFDVRCQDFIDINSHVADR